MTPANALELHGVSLELERLEALRDVNLTVRQGEAYALVGNAGAGKTLALKVACGLRRPNAGSIMLFGEPLQAQARSRMGVAPAVPVAAPRLSILDNLMVKALAEGLPDAPSRCRAVAEALGLNDLSRHARHLTRGERKRLCLAFALLGTPDLLILDEPFDGLDPQEVRLVRTLLSELVETRNVSMLLALREPGDAEGLATRYGVMVAGRITHELTEEMISDACVDSCLVRAVDPAQSLVALREALPDADLQMDSDQEGEYIVVRKATPREVSDVLYTEGQQILELSRQSLRRDDFFTQLMDGDANDA